MLKKKGSKGRQSNEINAGSMADIAFLLLIFFLVTTQIAEDKGVLTVLPPWSDDEPDITKLNERNVYAVLVNANNELLVRNEPMSARDLRKNAKEFISNPENRPDYAEKPEKAIISLKNDRGTKYETYIEVLNELKGAYNELRNEMSERNHGKPYEFLDKVDQRVIRNKIPLIISEAEPTAFGEEG
ncbi:MAG: biopolymer transport protein ExbD [Granulosicoccus sp.]|jgi:biopolymer transport protein ExbD